ncbi:MAG TPA: hypothetical protein VL404_09875 [Candidatus Eisenbacteria bacterium]|nr:hypothetical protein [Candidatus Eisenbacteria bacterium]
MTIASSVWKSRKKEGLAMADRKVCPVCGMRETEWTESDGKGVVSGGRTYCCAGCADGTGCTCKSGIGRISRKRREDMVSDPAHMTTKWSAG